MELNSLPLRFIDEPVQVLFDQPPVLEKDPPCPDEFVWNGEKFCIEALLAEWRDNQRRGRMSRNMRPEHGTRARIKGSWGVGRYFYRVRVLGGRIFELYYDRAPVNAGDRKGHWVLFGERKSDL